MALIAGIAAVRLCPSVAAITLSSAVCQRTAICVSSPTSREALQYDDSEDALFERRIGITRTRADAELEGEVEVEAEVEAGLDIDVDASSQRSVRRMQGSEASASER